MERQRVAASLAAASRKIARWMAGQWPAAARQGCASSGASGCAARCVSMPRLRRYAAPLAHWLRMSARCCDGRASCLARRCAAAARKFRGDGRRPAAAPAKLRLCRDG
ncbi:hypothetical protein F511_46162 [Dorcoceras hygrometricum]|uniref:Uncharacterized protein n=1 Tax=Dorcoceras hygrometricum TaxID=472368 RepID=A0A2Z6ZU68_9LAMI|nr:hypothetical protein F511_46162 [Dorcoceras hygrometricum]